MPPNDRIIFEEEKTMAMSGRNPGRRDARNTNSMTEFIVRERLAKDPEQAELYLLILSGIIFVSALMVPAVLVFSGPRLSQDVIQHAKPVLKAK